MPLFLIIANDAYGSAAKRATNTTSHLQALTKLNQQGKLHACGPLLQDHADPNSAIGSMFVVDFPTKHEANEWFQDEPFYRSGVYKDYTITPYIDGLPFCNYPQSAL